MFKFNKTKKNDSDFHPESKSKVVDMFFTPKLTLILTGQAYIEFENYLPKPLKPIGQLLKFITILFSVLLPAHFSILHIKTAYDAILVGDLQKMSAAGFMIVIFSALTFYVSVFLYNYQTLLKFFTLYNENYKHESSEGLTIVETHDLQWFSWKIMIYWQISCVGTTLLWCSIPLVAAERDLPLQCWYPFDPLQPGYYPIIYILQVLGQFQVGLGTSNCCGIYIYAILNICGQYDVLFCNLKNYIYRAELISKSKSISELKVVQQTIDLTKEEINQYLLCKEWKTNLENYKITLKNDEKQLNNFKNALSDALIECVEQHKFILKCCDYIETIFNAFNLIKSFQSILLLCFLAFTFVNVKTEGIFETITLFQYLFLSLLDIFMFTYPAEVLSQHSLKVGDAIYRSPWYLHIMDVKSDYLCLMSNTFQPIKLTGGKFFNMDVSQLRTIYTTAFSFMTLLRSINEN